MAKKRSLNDDFNRALAAAKTADAVKVAKRTSSDKGKLALTRYGYLLIDWPVVEDELSQSGGGAVLLGEKDDLTIARSDGPHAQTASAENLERLKADTIKILGPRFEIIEKHGNLFVGSDRSHASRK